VAATTGTARRDQYQYTFDNADVEAAQRLQLLAETVDEHSRQVLAGTGIGPGKRCLDIGPGAGTITTWLAERVGPTGHVTALDLDPRHVRGGPNIEVREGDVRVVELPPAHYDLVHARLVLMHLPDPDAVLLRLATALRPGGLLVVSDWDTSHRDMILRVRTPAAATAFDAYQDALADQVVANGGDLAWARRVPVAMSAAGLVDLAAVAHNRLFAGGEAGCLLHASNTHQLRDVLLQRGMIDEQLEVVREAMHDPETFIYSYWMFTTVGRRPPPARRS
jgi:SAM-dependent methyltransferase